MGSTHREAAFVRSELALTAPYGRFGRFVRHCAAVGIAFIVCRTAHGDAEQMKALVTDTKMWVEPTEPAHIVGPVYYVGTRGLGVYLINTSAGLVLIDGTVPAGAPLIEASIRKLGFKPEDIRQLLITHAHFDHVGTLAHFKELSGAPVAAMGPEVELLKSGGTLDYLFADNPKLHFKPVIAERTLADGDVVELGDVKLVAHATPGHTRGCTTWTTTVSDGGKSYLVEFVGSTSVNPGTRFLTDPSYPGIADDYRRSFALLGSLRPDIFLTPHAPLFHFEEKRERSEKSGVAAYVDPTGYRTEIEGSKKAYEAALEREKKAAHQ
jgi:metallo-beta-lactamase class B